MEKNGRYQRCSDYLIIDMCWHGFGRRKFKDDGLRHKAIRERCDEHRVFEDILWEAAIGKPRSWFYWNTSPFHSEAANEAIEVEKGIHVSSKGNGTEYLIPRSEPALVQLALDNLPPWAKIKKRTYISYLQYHKEEVYWNPLGYHCAYKSWLKFGHFEPKPFEFSRKVNYSRDLEKSIKRQDGILDED